MKKKTNNLNVFPWTKNQLTPLRKLIISTSEEWYEAKHPIKSKDEIRLINFLKKEKCPYCESSAFIKYGIKETGLQNYKCKNCKRSFTGLTNTIFDNHKIPISEWIEYLLHLIAYHSVQSSSFSNRNAKSTGYYWISKVFLTLNGYQDEIKLTGNVYLDETFVKMKKSKRITKNGKKLRGISQNLICVYTLRDDHHTLLINAGVSKPSFRNIWEKIGDRIAPGSTLIHDKEKAHNILIERLQLKDHKFDTKDLKNIDDKHNPLNKINEVHRYFKEFLRRHNNFKKEDLSKWLDVFSFIFNNPQNVYEKIDIFIKKAINGNKLLRYRGRFNK